MTPEEEYEEELRDLDKTIGLLRARVRELERVVDPALRTPDRLEAKRALRSWLNWDERLRRPFLDHVRKTSIGRDLAELIDAIEELAAG